MRVTIEPVDGPDLKDLDRRMVAVVVDALRASVTIGTALALGAERVLPLAEIEKVIEYTGREGYLTAGERGGQQVEGCDFGNSPGQLRENGARISGRTLVLSTSNGTRTILRASGAEAVLIGSMPNLSAVSEKAFRLAAEKSAEVAILPAGWLGAEVSEDLYTAGRIAMALAGKGAEFQPDEPLARLLRQDSQAVFAASDGGVRLQAIGYHEDVVYCATKDALGVVPILDGDGLVEAQ